MPPATKSAVGSLVQRNQSALLAFEQGAKCEQSRYPIDLTQGPSTQLPHLQKIKQAAQLEGLVGLSKSDARQPAEAANAVLHALALGRSLEAEPILISQLVRAACEALATDGLERTLNQVALPRESLDQLQQALHQAEAREAGGAGFTRALVREQVSNTVLFNLPREQLQELTKGDFSGEDAAAFKATMAKWEKNRKPEREFCEETFRQVLEARKEAFPARLKSDDLFVSRAAEAKSKGLLFNGMLLPALSRQAKKEAGSLAELRLSQTALALERFRAAHDNRYPAALGELSPQFLPAVAGEPV